MDQAYEGKMSLYGFQQSSRTSYRSRRFFCADSSIDLEDLYDLYDCCGVNTDILQLIHIYNIDVKATLGLKLNQYTKC